MKFFVAIAALVAVAVAFPHKPAVSQAAELEAIIAAIHSPNTDPATAALLEQQLDEILANLPIAVGPAIVEEYPISIGPAIVDFPVPDGGAVSAPCDLAPSPSPVVVGPIAPGSPAPLVQLIVNVNAGAGVVAEAEKPHPVIVVDEAEETGPVDVPVDPVQVVDINPEVVVDPVQVVDVMPIIVDPVQVGSPVFPSPAVNLPEELN